MKPTLQSLALSPLCHYISYAHQNVVYDIIIPCQQRYSPKVREQSLRTILAAQDLVSRTILAAWGTPL